MQFTRMDALHKHCTLKLWPIASWIVIELPPVRHEDGIQCQRSPEGLAGDDDGGGQEANMLEPLTIGGDNKVWRGVL
jgi:hypothetical protein